MPKDRRANSFSFNRAKASPYACSSKHSDIQSQRSFPPGGNEREWEEVMCPICMEHPHNAVLLLCSSCEKGCQPYMCNTSYRHSNCLDQFYKSSAVKQSGTQQDGSTISEAVFSRGIRGQASSGPIRSHGARQPELVCPLCRGKINGWVVEEAARKFMNSKTRSCSLETCNFTGNYTELRKHARRVHPSDRPSEADPGRQSDWTRLELQRDFEDTVSAYQAPLGDDLAGDGILTELPLDGGLADLLEGFSEGEDLSIEDSNMLLDFNFELSLSLLNEFPLDPWAWDEFSNFSGGRSPTRSQTRARSQNRRWDEFSIFSGGRSPTRSQTRARSQNRRPRRSAPRSDNHEERPASRRNTNLSSRNMANSYRQHRSNR